MLQDENTALMFANMYGMDSTATLLVNRGADLNIADKVSPSVSHRFKLC